MKGRRVNFDNCVNFYEFSKLILVLDRTPDYKPRAADSECCCENHFLVPQFFSQKTKIAKRFSYLN